MHQAQFKVLFTKKLSGYQIEKYSFQIDAYDFIKTKAIPFDFPLLSPSDKLVFTSQNAVEAVLFKHNIETTQQIYAVGEKTAQKLKEYAGFQHIKIPRYEQNAQALTALMHEEEANNFVYFCGKKRLPYLENYFKKNQKSYKVVEVYDTLLSPPTKLDVSEYTMLCFCSPSAVTAYLQQYEIVSHHEVLCIGSTTAAALVDYEKHLTLASQTSIESMLDYIGKRYKQT